MGGGLPDLEAVNFWKWSRAALLEYQPLEIRT